MELVCLVVLVEPENGSVAGGMVVCLLGESSW